MAADVLLRQGPDGPLPFVCEDIEDPAEMARRVAAWEAEHGHYSHVLFECEPGILYAPRMATGVLAMRAQPVMKFPEGDRRVIAEITPTLVTSSSVPAEALPFFAWCLVPLCVVTHQPGDLWRGVPMRKVGVNRVILRDAAQAGGAPS